MKNSILSVVFITLFSFGASSQRLWVGPELGGNLIFLDNDVLSKNAVLGWNSGVNVEFKFFDWLSARSGVYFNQTHQSWSSADTTTFAIPGFDIEDLIGDAINLDTYSSTRARLTQYSIQIPLTASFNYKHYGIYGGVYFGFNIMARKTQEDITTSPWVQAIDINSIDPTGQLSAFTPVAYEYELSESSSTIGYETFDFGFKFGLRYQRESFGASAGYTLGMLDYRSNTTGDKVVNQYFNASISYLFGLGKKKGSEAPR